MVNTESVLGRGLNLCLVESWTAQSQHSSAYARICMGAVIEYGLRGITLECKHHGQGHLAACRSSLLAVERTLEGFHHHRTVQYSHVSYLDLFSSCKLPRQARTAVSLAAKL